MSAAQTPDGGAARTTDQYWCERCGAVILPLRDAVVVLGKPYHDTAWCNPLRGAAPPLPSPGAVEAKPHNGQQEPRYTDELTVTCSMRYPDLTCHRPTSRCGIQEPHAIVKCGEIASPGAKPVGLTREQVEASMAAGRDPAPYVPTFTGAGASAPAPRREDEEAHGLPPDESPARDTVCDLLVAELRAVGDVAYEAGEATTLDLRDEAALRGLVRYMTARDSGGRDGVFGERKRVFWQRLGRALRASTPTTEPTDARRNPNGWACVECQDTGMMERAGRMVPCGCGATPTRGTQGARDA
jgi:hypothetical protein